MSAAEFVTPFQSDTLGPGDQTRSERDTKAIAAHIIVPENISVAVLCYLVSKFIKPSHVYLIRLRKPGLFLTLQFVFISLISGLVIQIAKLDRFIIYISSLEDLAFVNGVYLQEGDKGDHYGWAKTAGGHLFTNKQWIRYKVVLYYLQQMTKGWSLETGRVSRCESCHFLALHMPTAHSHLL